MFVFITAVGVALVVSFLCSIFEAVLLSIGHADLQALQHQGKRSGRLLTEFKRRIDVPIAAILIANTVAHTVGASVAGATYQDVFDRSTLWIFTIVFTAAVLLFTEIIPKTIGVTHARSLAPPVAHGIHVFTWVLRPLVLSTGLLSKLLRGGRTPPVTSLEEIRLLARLGRSEGVVGVRTANMIEGAARLRELCARDVKVPRSLVTFISGEWSHDEVAKLLESARHSRLPFSPSDDLDQVSGIVLAKDLLVHLLRHPKETIDWSSLVRKPVVVPATMPLNVLLRTFQEARSHMAIVLDEYGGCEGIVTLEDVLEEIVGEIVDESDLPAEELVEQPDGSFHARATLELRKVCQRLDIAWEPAIGVTSLAGLVSKLLGRLPRKGDRVHWNGWQLEVLAASQRRPERIAMVRDPEPDEEDEPGG